jgi:hypothetical protein
MTINRHSSMANSYTVRGGDIPSDDMEHQVAISANSLEMERLEWVYIPRLGAQVSLQVGLIPCSHIVADRSLFDPHQCQMKNTSEYHLPAGPMSVIVDDRYVAMVSIDVSFYPRSFPFILNV